MLLTTRKTTKECDQNRERLICFDDGMFHSIELFPQYKKKILGHKHRAKNKIS